MLNFSEDKDLSRPESPGKTSVITHSSTPMYCNHKRFFLFNSASIVVSLVYKFTNTKFMIIIMVLYNEHCVLEINITLAI